MLLPYADYALDTALALASHDIRRVYAQLAAGACTSATSLRRSFISTGHTFNGARPRLSGRASLASDDATDSATPHSHSFFAEHLIVSVAA